MTSGNATSKPAGHVPGQSPDGNQSVGRASGNGTHRWVSRSVGRWKWAVSSDWLGLLDDQGSPDWGRLDNDPRAGLVKMNPGRQVWRVRVGDDLVFAKIARPRDRWARWRRFFLGSDADRERRVADYAAEHSVDTVRPIASADGSANGRQLASILLTFGLPDAQPLNEFWAALNPEHPSSRRIKNRVIDVVARLIAQAHQNGFVHTDLHAGNVLVEANGNGKCRALFVDLQNVNINRPVSDALVTRNLAQFNQWFRLHAPLTDRLRFLDRYLWWRNELQAPGTFGRSLGCDRQGFLSEIEQAAYAHAGDLYGKRDRQAMRTGKYFARLNLKNGWRGHVFLAAKHPVPGSRASGLTLTADQWRDWLKDPLRWVAGADRRQMIKDSASAKVCRARLPLETGEPVEVICKRSVARNIVKRIKNTFRTSRAMLTWKRANALLNRRIPTARPLAVVERRIFGMLLDSVIITEHIAYAHDLDTLLTVQLREMSSRRQRQIKSEIIESLARVIRRFHSCGFVHRDLKAPNVMVQWDPRGDDPPRIMLVDLDGITQVRRPRPRACLRAMMRLNVSLDHCHRVSLSDRLRFLKRCLARPGNPDPQWKDSWRQIARMSDRKRRQRDRQQIRMIARHGRI